MPAARGVYVKRHQGINGDTYFETSTASAHGKLASQTLLLHSLRHNNSVHAYGL